MRTKGPRVNAHHIPSHLFYQHHTRSPLQGHEAALWRHRWHAACRSRRSGNMRKWASHTNPVCSGTSSTLVQARDSAENPVRVLVRLIAFDVMNPSSPPHEAYLPARARVLALADQFPHNRPHTAYLSRNFQRRTDERIWPHMGHVNAIRRSRETSRFRSRKSGCHSESCGTFKLGNTCRPKRLHALWLAPEKGGEHAWYPGSRCGGTGCVAIYTIFCTNNRLRKPRGAIPDDRGVRHVRDGLWGLEGTQRTVPSRRQPRFSRVLRYPDQ